MKNALENDSLILMEAAVVERLRRGSGLALHPTLVNAPFIYDETGRAALRSIYQEYIELAQAADVPFWMCTPTWRANRERTEAASAPSSLNGDAVSFMQEVRGNNSPVKIGGMIGCKNDCYLPEEALSALEAEQFHAWQINQLAEAGADFLIAQTIPSVEEAIGIAKAMQATGLPYLICFVISNDGLVLDGSTLLDAVQRVDAATNKSALGFMINCAYPTFLCADQQPKKLFERLIGFLANASSLSHAELENAEQIEADPVENWGDEMLRLHTQFGLRVLGGCCGTTREHLSYLVT